MWSFTYCFHLPSGAGRAAALIMAHRRKPESSWWGKRLVKAEWFQTRRAGLPQMQWSVLGTGWSLSLLSHGEHFGNISFSGVLKWAWDSQGEDVFCVREASADGWIVTVLGVLEVLLDMRPATIPRFFSLSREHWSSVPALPVGCWGTLNLLKASTSRNAKIPMIWPKPQTQPAFCERYSLIWALRQAPSLSDSWQ